MLVRGDSLAKSMSHYLIEQIEALPNVEVRTGSPGRRRPRATATCGRCASAAGRDRDGRGCRRLLRVHRRGPPHRLARRRGRPRRAGLHPRRPRRQGRRRGRSRAIRSRSRRACPACWSPATSARARSSAWPARSARARWRCRSSTSTWPRHDRRARAAGDRRRPPAGRPVRRPRRRRARRVGGGRRTGARSSRARS